MTMATVRCTQPGCDGTIQDGYCDICGLAAPAACPGSSRRRIELVDMANATRPRTLT